MPVVTTTESRREFVRRRHVGIAVQNVTDLVRVFLVNAGEREFCESFGGGCVEYRRGRVLRGEGERRKQHQGGEETSHRTQCNRTGVEWRLQESGERRLPACMSRQLAETQITNRTGDSTMFPAGC